ncbi:hypothetical protein ACI602_002225, partial [Neisseria gonorrhoeae]
RKCGIDGIGGLKPSLRNTLRRTQINTETYAPSFPRRRESGPWNNSNIQRLSEALGIPDSRFRGNDEF